MDYYTRVRSGVGGRGAATPAAGPPHPAPALIGARCCGSWPVPGGVGAGAGVRRLAALWPAAAPAISRRASTESDDTCSRSGGGRRWGARCRDPECSPWRRPARVADGPGRLGGAAVALVPASRSVVAEAVPMSVRARRARVVGSLNAPGSTPAARRPVAGCGPAGPLPRSSRPGTDEPSITLIGVPGGKRPTGRGRVFPGLGRARPAPGAGGSSDQLLQPNRAAGQEVGDRVGGAAGASPRSVRPGRRDRPASWEVGAAARRCRARAAVWGARPALRPVPLPRPAGAGSR